MRDTVERPWRSLSDAELVEEATRFEHDARTATNPLLRGIAADDLASVREEQAIREREAMGPPKIIDGDSRWWT